MSTITAATFVAVSDSAWAGPPFVTDDPEPVEYRRWEVNYAVTGSWRHGGASAAIPSIDINYGIVPDTQLHLQPRYSYERTGQDARSGVDDTELGIKYRFLTIEHDGASTMIGVYPIYRLPTGDRALGSSRGKGQLFLPLWVQNDSERWTFYGGPGYRINPGTGNKNSVFLGGTALYKLTQSLKLGAEVFHETPDSVEGTSTTGFNLGGICNLSHGYNFLFSAGKGLSNVSDTNQLSVYLALQALY
jgi:hypothetical protein